MRAMVGGSGGLPPTGGVEVEFAAGLPTSGNLGPAANQVNLLAHQVNDGDCHADSDDDATQQGGLDASRQPPAEGTAD